VYQSRGFSLLELLIAITIVGILFYIVSIKFYRYYKERAYVSTLLNNVRACFYEIMDYCEFTYNGSISIENFQACKPHSSLYGDVVFSIEGGNRCNGNNLPEGFKVKGNFSNVNYAYYAVCIYKNAGIKCSIEEQ